MHTVDLRYQTSTRRPGALVVRISNPAQRSISDYRIEALGHSGRVTHVAELCGYPRWSEPAPALVARCLDTMRARIEPAAAPVSAVSVMVGRYEGSWGPVYQSSLWVTTADHERYSVELTGQTISPVRRRFRSGTPLRDPVAIATRGYCRVLWRTDAVAPVPPPLQVPKRVVNGREYVRECDLPPWVRAVFVRHAAELDPTPAGEACPCYDVVEWRRFIGPGDPECM